MLYSGRYIFFLIIFLLFKHDASSQIADAYSVEGMYNVYFDEALTEGGIDPSLSTHFGVIHTDTGKDVYLSQMLPGVSPGEHVAVTGLRSESDHFNHPIFQVNRHTVLPTTHKTRHKTEGPQRVAVILFTYRNTLDRFTSFAKMDSVYFNGLESTSDYIKEMSGEQTWLEGQVFDNNGEWYVLDMDYPRNCFTQEAQNLLFETVNDDIQWFDEQGNQLYDRIAFHYPINRDMSCTSRATGALFPREFETPQGTVSLLQTNLRGHSGKGTVIHEQLHNYGIVHSNSWRGCSTGLYKGLGCFPEEYGFVYDVMGNTSYVGYLNSVMKRHLGWLDQIEQVESSGIYTLKPIEKSSEGTHALDIPRDEFTRYLVEFRAGNSFYSNRTQLIPPQVVVHYYYTDETNFYEESYALAVNEEKESFLERLGLTEGEQFVDKLTGIQIDILQINEDEAEVSITISPPEFTELIPRWLLDDDYRGHQRRPRAWKNSVVWRVYRNQTGEPDPYDILICTTDPSTDTPCEARDILSGDAEYISDPDIWENFVVWQNLNDIHIYDLNSEALKPLVVGDTEKQFPRISHGVVVWNNVNVGNGDIFACTLDTTDGTCINEVAITSDSKKQSNHAVYDNLIVWQDRTNDQGDIHYCTYKPETGICEDYVEIREPGIQTSPEVSADYIVWQHCNSEAGCFGGDNIMVYDLATQTIRPIDFSHNRVLFAPTSFTPYISDNLVVWDYSKHIAIHDLVTGNTNLLAIYADWQENPVVSDGVIYFENRASRRHAGSPNPKTMRFDYAAYKETFLESRVHTETEPVLQEILIGQNYPNPARAYTMLTYTLPSEASVSIEIFDMLGRKVLHPVDHQSRQPGSHQLQLNTARLAAGVYFYTITIDGRPTTNKMVVGL